MEDVTGFLDFRESFSSYFAIRAKLNEWRLGIANVTYVKTRSSVRDSGELLVRHEGL